MKNYSRVLSVLLVLTLLTITGCTKAKNTNSSAIALSSGRDSSIALTSSGLESTDETFVGKLTPVQESSLSSNSSSSKSSTSNTSATTGNSSSSNSANSMASNASNTNSMTTSSRTSTISTPVLKMLTLGVLSNAVYSNSYFGFTMSSPKSLDAVSDSQKLTDSNLSSASLVGNASFVELYMATHTTITTNKLYIYVFKVGKSFGTGKTTMVINTVDDLINLLKIQNSTKTYIENNKNTSILGGKTFRNGYFSSPFDKAKNNYTKFHAISLDGYIFVIFAQYVGLSTDYSVPTELTTVLNSIKFS